MKPYQKRLNLSFDLRREADRKAYEVLSLLPQKTTYVVQSVLAFDAKKRMGLSQEEIKQALREVLAELNGQVPPPQPNNTELPDDVFQLMEQL